MGKKVLIIGGVAGGATTAARLRRLDEEAEIIIFEKGPYISYANCGLPYHIGNVIADREALLLQTPEAMKQKFKVDVRVNNEVLSIDREEKALTVKDLLTGETYRERYDTLVISTGSSPLKPPIPGIDSEGIFTLWTVPDTDAIKRFIRERAPKHACVIGGGFIGLEMAENLQLAGCAVGVIEMQNQVMAPMDYEMAQLVEENMVMNGVKLLLSDGVKEFKKMGARILITLQSGKTLETDLVILSIGVRPNSKLAKEAGLGLNQKGGILTDMHLVTTDPNIYAVGDAIEVEEYMSALFKDSALELRTKTMIPLAGPANRQGRICANNICGAEDVYKGTQGTSVAQVFDMTVAATGLNEKNLKGQGLVKGRDYETVLIFQKSHAGYYPGAAPLALKLIFNRAGRIFGAQIVGQDGVDKRIDTLATTIRLGGDIASLMDLELAYAPPYSSAKDPVNMAGFVAENIIKGLVSFIDFEEFERMDRDKMIILDVGEDAERLVFQIEGSYHIPLGQLRQRISELDPEKLIVPYCAIGVRSYNAARILSNMGFKKVQVYQGGSNFYKAYHYKELLEGVGEIKTGNPDRITDEAKDGGAMNEVKATIKVNCSGLQCPGPIMKVFHTIKDIKDGEIMEVSATDAGFARDIEAWCKKTGNTLQKTEKRGKENVVYIKKGLSSQAPPQEKATDGATMVVFSGELDKALASFIIANGAASMGKSVTMFFTFWGLNVLRKPEKQHVKKPLIDSLFGAMMPRGTEKLGLSKMNMAGMGTAMMKKVMKDKNVNSLQELINQAMENGVKIVACTMSMDVMGLTREELIDGIEYAGVAAYLGEADGANVNLFI